MAEERPKLVARNLQKRFGERVVVRDVGLEVAQGEVVGLLGPNGAGKTTTFYMVVGVEAPDHGEIQWQGQDITNEPMHRRARLGIGYLPQESSVFAASRCGRTSWPSPNSSLFRGKIRWPAARNCWRNSTSKK